MIESHNMLGEILMSSARDEYTVIEGGHEGGYGVVFRVRKIFAGYRDYAAKFEREPDLSNTPEVDREACRRKLHEHFENEIARLGEMDKLLRGDPAVVPQGHPFPVFYGRGQKFGQPFYLMEWLEPLNLEEIRTEAERVRFVLALCDAVQTLHDNGYVHYDIKPGNIMRRPRPGTATEWDYVLSDFGSIHKEEIRTGGVRGVNPNSCSCLSDGRRFVNPHTLGYADPLDDLHTRNADIYAIGQVIRDLFREDVPPLWSRIIFRCISRNSNYRFTLVSQIKSAVLSMVHDGPALLQSYIRQALDPDGIVWARPRTTYHVKGSCGEEGDGTVQHPFRTIRAAIAAAPNDSIIQIEPGNYHESLEIGGKRLDLVGVGGADRVVIRGEPRKSVVHVVRGGDESTISGLTLTGGCGHPRPSSYQFDYYGGGVYAEASVHLKDCIIEENGKGVSKVSACTFGGGVCATNVGVTLENCVVRDNFAWASGGGLFAECPGGTLLLVNCTVEGNASDVFFGQQGGIGLTSSAVLSATRSIFRGNAGSQIGGFGAHAFEVSKGQKGTRVQLEGCLVEGSVNADGSVVVPDVDLVVGGGNVKEVDSSINDLGSSLNKGGK